MTLKPMTLCGSALALLLLAGACLQAAPIFNYSSAPDADKHFADGFGAADFDHFVDFSHEPSKDASVNAVTHQTHIVLTNLRVFSSSDDSTPDTINSNYGVSLLLQDLATGNSHTFQLTGNLQGTFSSGTANIDNTFTGPPSQSWTDSNGTKFTVALNAYTPPGPPDASLEGSIGATVTLGTGTPGGGNPGGGNPGGGDSGGGNPGPHDSPEPSTMLLAGLGLFALGGRAWWRWKRG